MTLSIRPARPADLTVLGQMAGALVRYHHALDADRYLLVAGVEQGYASWFARELANPDAILLVAEDQGELLGYAYGRIEERDWNALLDNSGALHDLYVHPLARRRGVGQQLLSSMIAALEAKGAPRIVLHTAVQNDAAQALFKAHGFRSTMLEMTRTRGTSGTR